ncbi:MAG: glycosyltransferase [Calditrichia bacterium]
MEIKSYNIVILGLSITSSWGNGHATTYRGLVSALVRQGHQVLFLERDVPWYRDNRDLPNPPYGRTELYRTTEDLQDRFADAVREADLVIVGSFVPDGVEVGRWVNRIARQTTAFYDIDTPVTLAKLKRNDFEYIRPDLIPEFDLYLSFTGGSILREIEKKYGAPMARPLYCSVDPDLYFPEEAEKDYDLGYLGTYSEDRQPPLENLMLEAARKWPQGRFAVAGPQYPESVKWPENIERMEHLPPARHRGFYNRQRFTLNITRADMIAAGYAPSVRLFEAAACGVPVISDYWDGLDTFFEFGSEILISRSPENTLRYLQTLPEEKRRGIAENARRKILKFHTADHRAVELVNYLEAVPSRGKGYSAGVALNA